MVRLRLILSVLSVLSFTMCGGGYDSPTAPTPTAPTPTGGNSVGIAITPGAERRTTDAFGANPLNVSVGSTVVWTNNDATIHNAIANNGAFSVSSIQSRGQGSVTFASPGTFAYHCGFHPNMVGTIVVQ